MELLLDSQSTEQCFYHCDSLHLNTGLLHHRDGYVHYDVQYGYLIHILEVHLLLRLIGRTLAILIALDVCY